MNYIAILENIIQSPAYRSRLDWGKPRKGHPEATVRAHIQELEKNLDVLTPFISEEGVQKNRILIHVHDTFKKDAKKGVPIEDPRSHASLAADFLAQFCQEKSMLNMVQYHDEPYALYRQERQKGIYSSSRLSKLLEQEIEWPVFLPFLLVDGFTDGKSKEPLFWCIENLAPHHGLRSAMAEWLSRLLKRNNGGTSTASLDNT